MSTLVVFADGRWLRIVAGDILARGEMLADALPQTDAERSVAIVPAADVIVRTVDLPDLADLQAQGAARIALADVSMLPPEALHVAVGAADTEGHRLAVGVPAAHLKAYLAALAEAGFDPEHLIAAPLLLARPETGFVRGDLGTEAVVRGTDTAFADDPVLTPLLTGDDPLETLDRPALEAGLVAAVEFPEADLRHGLFAKRRRWPVDMARLRRYALMALIIGVLVLTTQLVTIVRLNARASALEAETLAQATAVLPPGTTVTDAVLQSEARLAAMQGAGGGFESLAAAVGAAVNATPGVELGSMVFDGEGGLRATVRATSATDLGAVEARLAASGLQVVPGPVVGNQGRPYRDITVRAR
ncbi:type II secretion system protein GspL [Sphingomonas sp. SUN039]|uniref:type II secretion system protein GspL n=1 Tax=Sphingomonas sp. SUN039 TaxID=2937787 RepID=UPI002164AC93|nr:type II secretion system protein GspL [Sphingomonas sp. SUN039]UVO53913.1 type II secretion system protein GspL [Sphingomonas sp. SUN039]